jgi:hypothetical protein
VEARALFGAQAQRAVTLGLGQLGLELADAVGAPLRLGAGLGGDEGLRHCRFQDFTLQNCRTVKLVWR